MTKILPFVFLVYAATGQSQIRATSPESVIASFDGTRILLSEVDARISSQVSRLDQDRYALRRRALEEILLDRLSDAECLVGGITRESFLSAQVTDRVSPPTDQEVIAIYEFAAQQFRGLSRADALTRISTIVYQQRVTARKSELLRELMSRHPTSIFLDPVRAKIRDNRHSASRGNANAPISVVVFSDFQCPFCAKSAMTLNKVLRMRGDKVKIVYRHFPLSIHSQAEKAALYSVCALKHGDFWAFHDRVFDSRMQFTDTQLRQTAIESGVPAEIIDGCVSASQTKAHLALDVSEAQELGVEGTPTIYVNGRLSPDSSEDALIRLIDEEAELLSTAAINHD